MTSGADTVMERRILSAGERLEEALFTGLRLRQGIDLDAFAVRYGVDVWARYGDALQPFVQEGWLA